MGEKALVAAAFAFALMIALKVFGFVVALTRKVVLRYLGSQVSYCYT